MTWVGSVCSRHIRIQVGYFECWQVMFGVKDVMSFRCFK
jgi:hypothetical protein